MADDAGPWERVGGRRERSRSRGRSLGPPSPVKAVPAASRGRSSGPAERAGDAQPREPRWAGASEDEDWRRGRRAEPRWAEVLVWGLPAAWTYRDIMDSCCAKDGPRPAAARLLRNRATKAPLGDADAREVRRKLDGAAAGRARLFARDDLGELARARVALRGVDWRRTTLASLRSFLEQVGELRSLERAKEAEGAVAAFREAPATAAALAVLDGAILDGAPLRLARVAAREVRVPSPEKPPSDDEASLAGAPTGDTDWEAPLALEWDADTARGRLDFEKWEAPPEAPKEASARGLVRRSVAFKVNQATSFLAASPARAVSAAAASAPAAVEADVCAFEALLPQKFDVGGVAWRAGLWPDAKALWQMLAQAELVDPGPPPPARHVVLALCRADARPGEEVGDARAIAVVAALRPADPAASLSRSPLDPVQLMRGDGSAPSLHEPIRLSRASRNTERRRDVLLCLFDRRLAVKRPYLHGDELRPELVMTLLHEGEPAKEELPEEALEEQAALEEERLRKKLEEEEDNCFEPTELGTRLLELFNEKIGSDVTIQTSDGETIDAHASILGARSDYFYTALMRTPNREFDFNAHSAATLKVLMCFVYSDALVGDHWNVLDDPDATARLLDCGASLGVHGLHRYVEAVDHPRAPLHALKFARQATYEFAEDVSRDYRIAAHLLRSQPPDTAFLAFLEKQLEGQLEAKNVAFLLKLATDVDSEPLRAAAMAFARANLSQVMVDPQFAELLKQRSDLVFELLTALDGDGETATTSL